MSVRIRLARIGKKKAPFYRIVAVDKRVKRDGKCLENLGTYNPLTGEIIQFHADKIAAWLEKGAIPSDTVKRIQKQHARGEASPRKKTVSVAAPASKEEVKPVEKVAKEVVAEEKAAAPAVEAAPEKKVVEEKAEKAPSAKKESADKA